MKYHIIECKTEADLTDLNQKFSEIMSKRVYPFTKGAPFCRTKIEHCIELFKGTGKGKKPEACKGCRLIQWCDYSGKGFQVKAIQKCDPDLLAFLEERDESSHDWF